MQIPAELEIARGVPPPGCSVAEAERYTRRLATHHYENFNVASWLLPKRLHQHFYNLYAYCRWADDLGDEIADPARALELLDEWDQELRDCYAGKPSHPVFVALRQTIRACDIPIEPFSDLLIAFRQDQTVHRYATWNGMLGRQRPHGIVAGLQCDGPIDDNSPRQPRDRALVQIGWFSNAAPRSVAQIQNALCVWSPIKQRMRPLVRVIMMLENGIDVVPFEERHPISTVLFARAEAALFPFKGSMRRVRRHMIDNEHVRAVLTLLQRPRKPIGLCATDRRRVVRVEKY